MFDKDTIMELTRYRDFKITISFDGYSVRLDDRAGYEEGLNYMGDVRRNMDNAKNNSPIAQEFRKFYKRITSKYFNPKKLKGAAK